MGGAVVRRVWCEFHALNLITALRMLTDANGCYRMLVPPCASFPSGQPGNESLESNIYGCGKTLAAIILCTVTTVVNRGLAKYGL